jgi:hypothetical protein
VRYMKYILTTAVLVEHEALDVWATAPYYEGIRAAMNHSDAASYVDRESDARKAFGIPGVRE